VKIIEIEKGDVLLVKYPAEVRERMREVFRDFSEKTGIFVLCVGPDIDVSVLKVKR
jgi:hypothetical protein